ncbi:MAG: DUF4428 domain-containing protein [Clostridia bacterium]|nr:DUF4428 domain-containing protein [Clostridia bacterium]
MGIFGKLFEKKICSVCGGEIGLLGNRKLEDGNLCKTCAGKLSPFFSDRRSSTVEQIKEQLDYREENKKAVAAFHTTLSYGEDVKLLIDEDAKKFMVTRARDLIEANPDVLDFSQVTGVDIDVDEDRTEATFENGEGEEVSFTPPRYTFSYDFNIVIRVNSPYFDTVEFRLNRSSVEINPNSPVPMSAAPKPSLNLDYRRYEETANEIKTLLAEARREAREASAPAAPKAAVVCKLCGATTIPDEKGCCEYCGGPVV